MAEENLGTAVLSIVVDSKGLEESLNKAKQQIQKTSQELQRSLTAAPVNPVTGKTYAQERALKTALSISQELLATDLKREQTIRRIGQRIAESAKIAQGGFGEFSSSLSGTPVISADPVSKSIRRNQEKRDRAEQRRLAQLDALDADLVRVRQQRVDSERQALKARQASERKSARESAYDARQARERESLSTRRRQDIQGRISSGLIGGAFPLLFGQGPGAALGGLAGGVAGGGAFGFGASLVGTGVGAQFDVLIARSKELAEALRDPIGAFDQLKTASALSSRGLEKLIEVLIKSGQTAAAEELIRADLTQNFNPTLAAALSQANDELARSYSDVQEKLSAITAGPAIAFLQWLDDILDRLPISGPAGAEPGQLPTAAQGREQVKRGVLAQLAGIGLITAGGILGTLALPGLGSVAGAGLAAAAVSSVGLGAVAAGTSARAAGERVPEDLDTQQRIAATQKEIEATQARRVVLQKQLVGLTGDEKSGAGQIAQGQNVALQAQKEILEARKKFLSTPINSSAEEEKRAYEEYKLAIKAARIELEKLIATNNNQARSLKRTTDVRERTTGFTSSARQAAVLQDDADKARKDYDKAKAATASATGDELKAAQSVENKLGQIWRDATQNLADYNAELAFTVQRQAQVNQLAADKVAEDIKAVQAQRQLLKGAQSLAGISIQQSTLTQIQSIEAAVNAARRRESDLGNQIATARQRGDEALAADLVAQQKIAANETRLELEKGALALTEAGIKLRDTLRDVVVDFTSIRSDPEGLNKFLGPRTRDLRAQQDFQLLLPRFREAQDVFKQLTGAPAPEFRGPTADVNASIRDFIKRVGLEDAATKELIGTQKALSTNMENYNKTIADLATVTRDLASKNWLVNVAVQGAQAAAYGDVVNGVLSP